MVLNPVLQSCSCIIIRFPDVAMLAYIVSYVRTPHTSLILRWAWQARVEIEKNLPPICFSARTRTHLNPYPVGGR